MAISRFRIIEDLDNLTITQSHLNSHNDQHDYRIDAYHNNIHVGYADIVLYDGELTISYIEVDEKSRRLGIGSNIINYIKIKLMLIE